MSMLDFFHDYVLYRFYVFSLLFSCLFHSLACHHVIACHHLK